MARTPLRSPGPERPFDLRLNSFLTTKKIREKKIRLENNNLVNFRTVRMRLAVSVDIEKNYRVLRSHCATERVANDRRKSC